MGAAPRVACPTCQCEVEWNEQSRWRPFCSERCRMVDLGAWFSEEHRIAGDTAENPAAEPAADTDSTHRR